MAPEDIGCGEFDRCAAAASCTVSRQPCSGIGQGHSVTLALCSELEVVVAMLPDAVGRLACLRVANELLPHLRDAHRVEEELLATARHASGTSVDAALAARLRAGHVESELAAQALTATLLTIGHGAPIPTRDALEAEVESFTTLLRRHVDDERAGLFGGCGPLSTGLPVGTAGKAPS